MQLMNNSCWMSFLTYTTNDQTFTDLNWNESQQTDHETILQMRRPKQQCHSAEGRIKGQLTRLSSVKGKKECKKLFKYIQHHED